MLQRLSAIFEQQHHELERQWADGDSSTEDLRTALQRCRTSFERLRTIQGSPTMLRRILNQAARGGAARRRGPRSRAGGGPGGGATGGAAGKARGAGSLMRGLAKRRRGL